MLSCIDAIDSYRNQNPQFNDFHGFKCLTAKYTTNRMRQILVLKAADFQHFGIMSGTFTVIYGF